MAQSLLPLPRPKDVSPGEISNAVRKAIPITFGTVALLVLTLFRALATTAITVINAMVEQIARPRLPKSKRY